ncbi:hypothetical protein B0H66DRAFT_535214 [Apodospora peruviana]|uniref:Uncharacterized protein n=1 Tax=Apodospora peruviana TaxID=516989 RepID=A0AAE0I1Z8_9PEZI|nr:hypothetical protein B0H66DRAFT_535214 [Apodospora peruviana]
MPQVHGKPRRWAQRRDLRPAVPAASAAMAPGRAAPTGSAASESSLQTVRLRRSKMPSKFTVPDDPDTVPICDSGLRPSSDSSDFVGGRRPRTEHTKANEPVQREFVAIERRTKQTMASESQEMEGQPGAQDTN